MTRHDGLIRTPDGDLVPDPDDDTLDATSSLTRTPDEIRQHVAELRRILARGRDRKPSDDLAATSRVSCVEADCRSELLCRTSHVDNLSTSWRCLEHRETPNTDPTGKATR